MTTLEQRIERVKELNAKRSQGEWRWHSKGFGLLRVTSETGWWYVIPTYCEACDKGHEDDIAVEQPRNPADKDFICAAPEMVSIIEALQQRLKEREDVIATMRHHGLKETPIVAVGGNIIDEKLYDMKCYTDAEHKG